MLKIARWTMAHRRIVVVTWIFSLTVLRFAWTRRAELLAGSG